MAEPVQGAAAEPLLEAVTALPTSRRAAQAPAARCARCGTGRPPRPPAGHATAPPGTARWPATRPAGPGPPRCSHGTRTQPGSLPDAAGSPCSASRTRPMPRPGPSPAEPRTPPQRTAPPWLIPGTGPPPRRTSAAARTRAGAPRTSGSVQTSIRCSAQRGVQSGGNDDQGNPTALHVRLSWLYENRADTGRMFATAPDPRQPFPAEQLQFIFDAHAAVTANSHLENRWCTTKSCATGCHVISGIPVAGPSWWVLVGCCHSVHGGREFGQPMEALWWGTIWAPHGVHDRAQSRRHHAYLTVGKLRDSGEFGVCM